MESNNPPAILDEDQYRWTVLRLPSAESEQARTQQLADEARQLGLKVPEIEVSASSTASITSGLVDLSSPVLSSGSSIDRISTYEGSITPSYEPTSPSPSPSPLDQAVSSLSEITIASDHVKPGSTRSLASLSTRPTSYASSEGRANNISSSYSHNDGLASKAHRSSLLSVASADKKDRRGSGSRSSSLKSAIERIHFRKKRTPSTDVLPPTSPITVSKDESGDVDRMYLKSRAEAKHHTDHEENPHLSSAEDPVFKLESPVFDQAALQRTLDDPELSEMHERHRMEKNRHLAFQDAALSILRRRHQAAVSARQSDHQHQEEKKRAKNQAAVVQIEERQLTIEMDQQREFERTKLNSRTRIKHMEGYFRNASPPPSPAVTAQASTESIPGLETTLARHITRQNKEQLEQQYHEHESMDQLHEARIKVLRERQELKLHEAIARMDQELESMCDQHATDVSSLQSEHSREEMALLQALDAKKTSLRHRWLLEEAILRCQLESRHGQLYGPMPPLTFTQAETSPSVSSVLDSPLGAGNPPSIPLKQGGGAL